jgi:deaminated glutathione amidase
MPQEPSMSKQKLTVATCQFAENWQPLHNARIMCRLIAQAAEKKADVVHFHECALSGYGEAVGTPQYDWAELKKATKAVLEQARRSKVWVVFGSSHPLTPPHKPHNSLYVVSPAGRIVDRYDKRFCTGGDLECYSPGDHYVIFRISGIICSCLICYDVRFPELYRDLARLGVRVVFHSFHNARRKKSRGIWNKIMRRTVQAHAGMNSMWISANNSTARLSCWPSVFVTPDGLVARQMAADRSGVMVNVVDPTIGYYDATGGCRELALKGRRNTGKAVRDGRSRVRTCY